MTFAAGRPVLAIPGPSPVPDRVLRAMHRPAPDIYEAAAAACGVPPARCLVIEDSDAGAAAGTAAGCQVLFEAVLARAGRVG